MKAHADRVAAEAVTEQEVIDEAGLDDEHDNSDAEPNESGRGEA